MRQIRPSQDSHSGHCRGVALLTGSERWQCPHTWSVIPSWLVTGLFPELPEICTCQDRHGGYCQCSQAGTSIIVVCAVQCHSLEARRSRCCMAVRCGGHRSFVASSAHRSRRSSGSEPHRVAHCSAEYGTEGCMILPGHAHTMQYLINGPRLAAEVMPYEGLLSSPLGAASAPGPAPARRLCRPLNPRGAAAAAPRARRKGPR